MNEEEFEELFGNTPFENIKKIQHYIDKNYIPVQKVKAKIEQLKMNANYDWMYKYDYQDVVKMLQELLEESE